ncbi:MAG: tRNA (adenosine(37)-N6)-threonylcarbamoyltransferase complex transferase subunit TsaD [Candidatus Paceibacterota bacterium]|jgi:N6-L-threonylcarbamoyladenine synthase
MIILGIETSCDETAICIIETDESSPTPKIKILGNQLYSQIELHTQYGGVFPMMAKREHVKNLTPILEKCLEESKIIDLIRNNSDAMVGAPTETSEKTEKIKDILIREQGLFEPFIELAEKIEGRTWNKKIDAIAVTNGPGLEPALWVGVSFAKALSEVLNVPIMPTNHMEGHIMVAPLNKISDKEFEIKNINFPAIALLISGGHTQLVLIKDNLKYEIIGNTKDDAIGEAFDKVARILGLAYPGGPLISKLAEKERSEFPDKVPPFPLPRPMIHSKDLNFSFSGIKTAVLYTTQKIPVMTDSIKQEIAREFEDAVVEVIVTKTKRAVENYGAQTIIMGGGVSANKKIRNDFAKLAEEQNIEFLVPEISASTDNAFMIALAGYINIKDGKKPEKDFKANGNLTL